MTKPKVFYRARGSAILDQDGRQVAVVLPSNCTNKLAREMAAYAAQQANHAERQRERQRAAVWPARTPLRGEGRG